MFALGVTLMKEIWSDSLSGGGPKTEDLKQNRKTTCDLRLSLSLSRDLTNTFWSIFGVGREISFL